MEKIRIRKTVQSSLSINIESLILPPPISYCNLTSYNLFIFFLVFIIVAYAVGIGGFFIV